MTKNVTEHKQLSGSVKATLAQLDNVNNKVVALRKRREKDPDTMGDKVMKTVLPSLLTFFANKIVNIAWSHLVSSFDNNEPARLKHSRAHIKSLAHNAKSKRNLKPSDGSTRVGKGKGKGDPLWSAIGYAIVSAAVRTIVSHYSRSAMKLFVSWRQRKRVMK